MKYSVVSFVFIFLLFGCNNSNKPEYVGQTAETAINEPHPGKKLMESYCYACHNPTSDHDNRLGPPMIAIKKHYITSNTSKNEFIKDIQEWVKNPSEANAKMYGAVNRFGVMPKTPFPEEAIEQIAEYMFDNDIEQPDWFEDHYKEEQGRRQRNGMRKGMGKQMRKNKS